MCRELLRILAAPARILREPCRVLPESWLQNASAFAHFSAKKFFENHPKMGSKPLKSTKTVRNGTRANKNSPQDQKGAEKGSSVHSFLEPPGHPKSAKIKKRGSRKSMIFSTPSWNRLCLILGCSRDPKSSQNEVKIGSRTAQTHFRPDCIFCRPCQ